MAFKMKGSAFKLGNVATKSVLKQKEDPRKEINRPEPPKDEVPGPPMKSPLEHKATPGEKSYNLRTFKTPTGEQNYGSAESHNKTYGTDRHHDAKPKERAKVSEASGTKKKKKFIDAKLEASGPKPPPSSAALMKSPLEHEGDVTPVSSTERREMGHDFYWLHNGMGYDRKEYQAHKAEERKAKKEGTENPNKTIVEGDYNERESGPQMKSPMKQDERPWYKKGWDEVTQVGEGLVEAFEPYKGDYTDAPESIVSKFNRGYSKEEKADDPVYQAELLKKKEIALAKERKIKKEADIKSDIDREAKLKKTLEQSKGWDAETKAKYLDEDGNIKPEHLEGFLW